MSFPLRTCVSPYLEEGVDFDSGLGDAGKSTLSTLACRAQTTEGTRIAGDIEFRLALELIFEMIKECVIEIFTTKMGVTSGGFHGEDTSGDVQKGNIESSSSQIEDEDILLGLRLTIKTVGNGSSSGLVDDTEDIEARDGASILGSKSLRVIEVSRNAVYRSEEGAM